MEGGRGAPIPRASSAGGQLAAAAWGRSRTTLMLSCPPRSLAAAISAAAVPSREPPSRRISSDLLVGEHRVEAVGAQEVEIVLDELRL